MAKKETIIRQWNRVKANEVMNEIAVVLRPILAAHDLMLKRSGGTYNDLDLNLRYALRVRYVPGGTSADQMEWEKYCRMRGLEPEHFGKKFVGEDGRNYQIIGIKPKARKFSIIVLCLEDGKKYVWSARDVAKRLQFMLDLRKQLENMADSGKEETDGR